MVELKQLSKSFGRKQAVCDVTYSFQNGVYGLLGPNGAGKTTMIRCMLGLYSHKGNVIIGDSNSTNAKHRIGYLPQKNNAFPGLTVEEHLQYFANLKKIEKQEISAEVERVLNLVNLTDQKTVKGRKLSGGMIRRLGIAQALLGKPELVIFDEPTTGLDPEERIRYKNIIRHVGQESTVLMSTHIVEDVEAVCNRILIMKEGSIVASGTQEEISQYAEGRVYELPREQQLDSWYVEKELMRDEKEYIRILTNEDVEAEAMKPTIEDGYLCVLKGIK